jgi:hypothetical protein
MAAAAPRSCTPGHASLCHQHLGLRLDDMPPSEDTATDILSSIQNFQSAAAVNAGLDKILALLAAGRVKRQDAIAMAYICQLLLQSLQGFKHEILLTTYEKSWERDLIRVLNERTPIEELVFRPVPEALAAETQAEVSGASAGPATIARPRPIVKPIRLS